MASPYPLPLVELLRCPRDGGPLVEAETTGVHCGECGVRYPIADGVLDLGVDTLHPESDRERRIRDQEAAEQGAPPGDTDNDLMEIDATLEALDLRPEHRLLELGSGRGRFTKLVAPRCRAVVGIDISRASLMIAADEVGSEAVAFVHGDATAALTAPAAFDRILGTLTSNLPDRETRVASYRNAARALAPDGLFVFTTHYFGWRARLDNEAKDGEYFAGGIYRCLLEPDEIHDEIGPFFSTVEVRPIQVVLPLTTRLGLPLLSIDRIARRIPLLRNFGGLLLVIASGPRGQAGGDAP